MRWIRRAVRSGNPGVSDGVGLMKRFLKAAGDVLLPRVCLVCGGRLNLAEEHLCLGCLMDMPLTRFWGRRHNPMADKFNEKIQRWVEAEERGEEGCGAEAGVAAGADGRREKYAYAAALFIYHSAANYRHIPYQIKYQGNTAVGEYFGRMLGQKLAGKGRRGSEAGTEAADNGGIWEDVDMIIPVPLHWMRRWKRGYNQAEVIAGAVAQAMDVPMRNDILERRRRTKTQIRLSIEEKTKNVNGAFAVREAVRQEMAEPMDSSWKNIHHIILVDDVFTTGSTLAACFAALRDVFPPSVRISAVTLGYLER